MNFYVELLILFVLFVWLSAVSFFLLKLISKYKIVFQGTKKQSIVDVLQHMNKNMELSKKEMKEIVSRVDVLETQGKSHLQKVGLMRFNPFHNTGGDQSFILALVDDKQTGVIISGLYSRSGTRWYAKKVLQGKGIDVELSEEEKKALHLAK